MGHPPVPIRHAFFLSKGDQGSDLADFLEAHLISESSKLHEDIPDEIYETNMTSEDEVW